MHSIFPFIDVFFPTKMYRFVSHCVVLKNIRCCHTLFLCMLIFIQITLIYIHFTITDHTQRFSTNVDRFLFCFFFVCFHRKYRYLRHWISLIFHSVLCWFTLDQILLFLRWHSSISQPIGRSSCMAANRDDWNKCATEVTMCPCQLFQCRIVVDHLNPSIPF